MATIEFGGLVHRTAPLDASLRPIRRGADGSAGIALVDVLAIMQVDADAEVLVAVGADGSSLALPIREIVTLADARIVFDGEAVLRVPDWTHDGDRFVVVSFTAMTFRDFLGRTAR